MPIARKAGSVTLALTGVMVLLSSPALADLTPSAQNPSPSLIDCAGKRQAVLQHFQDSGPRIPTDPKKAEPVFASNCSVSRQTKWDKHDNIPSLCLEGWYNMLWAVQAYANTLEAGCVQTVYGLLKCQNDETAEKLQACAAEVEQQAADAEAKAKATLDAAVRKAQETIDQANARTQKINDSQNDERYANQVGHNTFLYRLYYKGSLVSEQTSLKTSAEKFVQAAQEEQQHAYFANEAYTMLSLRAASFARNSGTITGLDGKNLSAGPPAPATGTGSSPPSDSGGAGGGSGGLLSSSHPVLDSLNLATGALGMTAGGIALSRALNGGSGAPANPGIPSAEPAAGPSETAASSAVPAPAANGLGASASNDVSPPGDPSRTVAASAPAQAAPSSPLLPAGVTGGPSGIGGTSGQGDAGLPGTGGAASSAAAARASGGGGGAGDFRLADREPASTEDSAPCTGAVCPKSGDGAKGVGTGSFGGGLGPSKPFVTDGPAPTARELAGMAPLDFKNEPLTNQEKDLLKLLDGFDGTKDKSPAEARKFLADALGRPDPNGDFTEDSAMAAATQGATAGLAGAETMSLFARVRFAHKRATKRGLIIGMHEQP